MMYPRLQLLKQLLSPDGLLAISIDDNEVNYLGLLLDELFGAKNRLACAPWLAEPSGGKEKTGLRGGHEYVLIYHNGDDRSVSRETRSTGELNLKDKWGKYRKGRELMKWGGISLRKDRPGQWFPLRTPDGVEAWPIKNDGEEGHWRWGKEQKMKEIVADPDCAHWEVRPFDAGVTRRGQKERWVPYEKIRDKSKSIGWSTWLDSFGFNADATRELKEIFGRKPFDTPKPTALIRWLVSLHADDDAIVLDSFGGSGTTAHAVLSANKEDGGNRRFILVECEDYADSITAERVRRVIKGVHTASDENLKKGLGGTFSYFALGKAIELDSILDGKNLPSYLELARYVFYTATGEEFDERKVNEKRSFVGESKTHEVYLFYQPDMDYLKKTALTLERAESLGKLKDKRRLVFAPTKYLDQEQLDALRIDFAQSPFVIYKLAT